MKRIPALVVSMLSFVFAAQAQDVVVSPNDDGIEGSIGIGAGLDYGGVGVRLAAPVMKYVEIFGAVGYNLKDIGFNGGLAFYPLPKPRLRPVLVAMYGYNGVLEPDPAKVHPRYDRTYYGLSFGGGVSYEIGDNGNYISAKVLYPLHASDWDKTLDLDTSLNPMPVTFSVGFHLAIGN